MQNTELKHTLGPWTVLPQYTNRAVYPIGYKIDHCSHGILAEVNSQGGMEADCTANARLIASAPELLAALQSLILAFDSDADGRLGVAIVNDARTAISKAIGGVE